MGSPYRMNSYCNRLPMFTWPIRVDLGAGNYPQPGMVRIDFDGSCGAEIQWDICNGIPLPDASVSELYTSHCLEHLVRTDYHYVLQEIFRVCQNGAPVTIKLPYGGTKEGKLPCHYSFFVEEDMQAIAIWFPPENGPHWSLKEIAREGIHLIGRFVIHKP